MLVLGIPINFLAAASDANIVERAKPSRIALSVLSSEVKTFTAPVAHINGFIWSAVKLITFPIPDRTLSPFDNALIDSSALVILDANVFLDSFAILVTPSAAFNIWPPAMFIFIAPT